MANGHEILLLRTVGGECIKSTKEDQCSDEEAIDQILITTKGTVKKNE